MHPKIVIAQPKKVSIFSFVDHVVSAAELVKLRSGVNGLNALWADSVTQAKPKKAPVDSVGPSGVSVYPLVNGVIGKLVSMKESVLQDKLKQRTVHQVAVNELVHAQITVVGVNGVVVRGRMLCVCQMKFKAKIVVHVDRPESEPAVIFANGALGENAKARVMSVLPVIRKINLVVSVKHKQEYVQMNVFGEIGGGVKQALAHQVM